MYSQHTFDHARPSPETSPVIAGLQQAAAGCVHRQKGQKEERQCRYQPPRHHPRAGHAGGSILRLIVLHDLVRVVALGLSTVVYTMAVGGAIHCTLLASPYPLESLRGTESTNKSLKKQKGPIHLTPTQLSLYNGTDPSLPIYLAVNGTVFDVSANRMMYGPGGHYNFFTGRDATRAFVTGCFQEDLTHDLRGVEEIFIPIDHEEQVKGLSSGERKIRREQDVRVARGMVRRTVQHWEGFFRGHKKYFEVGRVVGLVVSGEKRELCQAAVQQRPEKSTRGGH